MWLSLESFIVWNCFMTMVRIYVTIAVLSGASKIKKKKQEQEHI